MELIIDIAYCEDNSIRFFQEHNLLRSTAPNCQRCGREMTLVMDRGERKFRCPSHKGEKISIRKGTFFENANLQFKDVVQILFMWASDLTCSRASKMLEFNYLTVLLWFRRFRVVCEDQLNRNPVRLGGIGMNVELDESVVAKRKHHRGRIIPERWVFGGICRETNDSFMVIVPDRTATTLLALILQHVVPGSIIHTDGWASYQGIGALAVNPAYTHLSVNHRIHFVDPVTGACTNRVECLWNLAKVKFKEMRGAHNQSIDEHLNEFLWRRRYGPTPRAAFMRVIEYISVLFPID